MTTPGGRYPDAVPLPEPRRGATLLLALAGGLLTDAGFPGLGVWPLAFVGVALLFLALARDSARWNALVGLVYGLAFFLPHITWAEEAVGAVPWLALALLQAIAVALFGAAWAWARRGAVIWHKTRLQVPVFAVLWVGMEEARSVAPFGGFPWGRLAVSQADSPLGRWAWAGGTPLVSGLVVVIGVLLALAVVVYLLSPRMRRHRPWIAMVLAGLTIGIVVAFVPIVLGLPISPQYFEHIMWFPSWI